MIKKEMTKSMAIPENVRVSVSDRVSPAQQATNIVGKGRVRHPAVVFTLTFKKAKKDGNVFVTEQNRLNKAGTYEPQITLLPGLHEEFLRLLKAGNTEEGAWYLGLVGKSGPVVTDGPVNPELDILDIQFMDTERMHKSGIVARCTLVTSIGEFRGMTISVSAYNDVLTLREPDADDNNRDAGTVYKLTDEAKAQILAYFHNQLVDWDDVHARRPELQSGITERQAKRAEEAAAKAAAAAAQQTATAAAASEVDEAFGAYAAVAADEELPA